MAKDDISLFGTENEISEETVNTGSKLDLIKFKALKVDSVEKWQDLFAGFTELKAVTFSSSLGMIKWFCRNFQKLEIIFGNENVAGDKMRLLEEQAKDPLQTQQKTGFSFSDYLPFTKNPEYKK